MERVKLGFISGVFLLIFGGFGHEIYHAAKTAGDPGPLLRTAIEGWYKSPGLMALVSLGIGYLIGHAHPGGK